MFLNWEPVFLLSAFASRHSSSVCERSALSGFWVQSCFLKSEDSVLIDLTTKSTKKLMVEPQAMVGLGLCSAAIHVVSDGSLFTALDLSALKPWLVRPARECGDQE